MKRKVSAFLAMALLLSSLGDARLTAYGSAGMEGYAALERSEDDDWEDEELETTAAVDAFTLDYDQTLDKFILRYTLSGAVSYVKIYMDGRILENEYDKNATSYEYFPEDPEDKTFEFYIIPCEKRVVDGVETEVEGEPSELLDYTVPVKDAVLKEKGVTADYDMLPDGRMGRDRDRLRGRL